MLKELRIKAKGFLKCNYKALIPVACLIMALNAVTVAIVEYAGYINSWEKLSGFVKAVLLFVYFFVRLAAVPLISAVFFKIIVILQQQKGYDIKSEIKTFLNAENIKKIFLINIIPTCVNLLAYSSGISFLNIFNFGFYLAEFSAVLKLIAFLVSYKFLMCNYYFALNQSGVKETVSVSFKVMKLKKIFRLIYILLIFLPWAILDGVIYFAINFLVTAVRRSISVVTVSNDFFSYIYPDLNYPAFLSVLNCFWLGLGFYVLPYVYTILPLFLEQLFKDYKNGH